MIRTPSRVSLYVVFRECKVAFILAEIIFAGKFNVIQATYLGVAHELLKGHLAWCNCTVNTKCIATVYTLVFC